MRHLFAFLCVLLWPAATWGLRLVPLPEVAAWPAAGPALDQAGFVDLSLRLSGVTAEAVSSYHATLDRWSGDFQAQTDPGWDQAKKAEALLAFLHSHLKSYSLYQTQLDVLIDKGTFNCVSSALAFMILGRSAGLDVGAVATADHAFDVVHLDSGRNVDVETTTKFGFDPGTKVGFTNAFGQTGFVYVPPGHYSQRKPISDRQLLGLLVQNRMVVFFQQGRAEEAVGPAIDRWVVEATPEAFQGLVDGFVNYGKALNDQKEFVKGLDLVEKMLALTGPVDEVKQLAGVFVNNQVSTLLDRRDFAAAQDLATTWKNRGLLSETQAGDILALIGDNQLAFAVNNHPAAQAATEVEKAYAQGSVTATKRRELLSVVFGQEVQRVSAQRGPQAAYEFLGTLPPDIQALAPLAKAKDLYQYNWGVVVHNHFVDLWNSGKKEQGRQLLRDTLMVLPSNSMIKKDLASIEGL